HRLAYIATRMPATFAANNAVFSEVQRLLPEQKIQSVLDLGAGPGTASWAATQTFSEIQNITLIERDPALIQIGKSLSQTAENTGLQNATWMQKDLSQLPTFPTHDLIVCSYALNELSLDNARQVLNAAWSAARVALILIEPGTMPGFALIRQLRDDLIQRGGHLIAPCPHQEPCPLPPDDWCHFSQRLNRTSLHRHLKVGHLGYEDEKFSYIAASKTPIVPAQARVLRHPIRRTGHTQMQLCTQDGLQNITVTRSDKPNWRRVKKTNWGDAWS
ncbi:MAG: methyltransferase domain-containing protein, partial [Candidatus Latescibacteria bacterium]|nr:methyltransferase domain-containing protein [Candidatus Latescibacterota bacterium]